MSSDSSKPRNGMQYLELTPEQYSELCEKRMALSRVCDDGTVNTSAFLQWAIEKYGLEIDEKYHIRVLRGGSHDREAQQRL